MRLHAVRALVAVLIAVLPVASCVNDRVTQSRSSSLLIIERITASSGGSNEEPIATLLQSDVMTGGGVFDDVARVTTRLALKDPGTVQNPSAPTTANYITVDRYRVEYQRSDGRQTPGVDVPYAFDGAMTFTTAEGVHAAEFVLVRASAKLEAPLVALAGGGGAIVINTLAVVTFYGHDQTGEEISATGTIGVNFADWDDGAGAGSGA